MTTDNINYNNYDDLLAEATNNYHDNVNDEHSGFKLLHYLQNLLKISIDSKEFEERYGRNYLEYLVSIVKKQ